MEETPSREILQREPPEFQRRKDQSEDDDRLTTFVSRASCTNKMSVSKRLWVALAKMLTEEAGHSFFQASNDGHKEPEEIPAEI